MQVNHLMQPGNHLYFEFHRTAVDKLGSVYSHPLFDSILPSKKCLYDFPIFFHHLHFCGICGSE